MRFKFDVTCNAIGLGIGRVECYVYCVGIGGFVILLGGEYVWRQPSFSKEKKEKKKKRKSVLMNPNHECGTEK